MTRGGKSGFQVLLNSTHTYYRFSFRIPQRASMYLDQRISSSSVPDLLLGNSLSLGYGDTVQSLQKLPT